MRILQVGGLAGPGPVAGGVWRVAETQSSLLRAQGHDVDLFGLWLAQNPPQDETTHRLPARPPFPGAGYRGLLTPHLAQRLFEHGPYDVAHIHLARDYFSTQALRLVARRGIPVVVQTHGMIAPATKPSTRLFDLAAKRGMVSQPDAWLALTDTEERDLQAFGARHIMRVDNPVLPSGWQWMPSPERYLLFASRLHERKQADVLVRAVDRAHRVHPDIRLLIAGPDEGARPAVEAAIAAATMPERFELLGPLDQTAVRERLAHAHAMVLPSRAEVAPMIAIEACEMGTPMILTSDSGLSAGLAQAEAAIISEPTQDALEQAVIRMWSDPTLPGELSVRARSYYADHWSPEHVGEQLETIYASVMGAPGRA